MSLPATAAAHPVLSAVVCLGTAGLLAAPFAVALQVSREDAGGTVLSLPELSGGPRAALDRLADVPLATAPPVVAAAASRPVLPARAADRDVLPDVPPVAVRRAVVALGTGVARTATRTAATVVAAAPVTPTTVVASAAPVPTTTVVATAAPVPTTTTAPVPTTSTPTATPTTTPTEAPTPVVDTATGDAEQPSYGSAVASPR